MTVPAQLDIGAYAALSAVLADPDCDRAEVLAEHGLDEEGWSKLDRFWQDQLARAMDEQDDGVPALVATFAAAFERARTAIRSTDGVISIERFADATREIRRRGDPLVALKHVGISLEQFLRANEHWTRRMLQEPDLLDRFRARLG